MKKLDEPADNCLMKKALGRADVKYAGKLSDGRNLNSRCVGAIESL